MTRIKRYRRRPRPPLDEDLILSWADAHFERHGVWPKRNSGPVDDQYRESWGAIDMALKHGSRGLLLGSSLALLLQERRGVARKWGLPRFTVEQILLWMDQYKQRSGVYPNRKSGAVDAAPAETWARVDAALHLGLRGLPGKSSLTKLRREHCGDPFPLPLTINLVLKWMDEHHARTGEWPTKRSGSVAASPNERWSAINAALYNGRRGLPGGTSLIQLAVKHRGQTAPKRGVPLSKEVIGEWMKVHAAAYGHFPSASSGEVLGVPGESWNTLEAALKTGVRGLPGGQSVAQLKADLIAEGILNPPARRSGRHADLLNLEQIVSWMQEHAERHGKYPTYRSGHIENGLTWSAVDAALAKGHRGLPGGQRLSKLKNDLIAEGRFPDLRQSRSKNRKKEGDYSTLLPSSKV